MSSRLAVFTALELREAARERREPVPEAVVEEWPARSAVRILEKPKDDEAYDGVDI